MKKISLSILIIFSINLNSCYRPNYNTADLSYTYDTLPQVDLLSSTIETKNSSSDSESEEIKKDSINNDNSSNLEVDTETNEEKVVDTEPDEKLSTTEKATKIIFQRFLDNMKEMKSFKATLKYYGKGNYTQKKYSEKVIETQSDMNVVFERPRKMLLNIEKSVDSPNLNGTRFYFDGGPKVKIRVPGVLGLFAFTFSKDKPEFSNVRGYETPDIDPVSLEQRITDDDAKLNLSGVSTVDGHKVYLIEVTNIKHLDDKITKEVIGIRKTDYSIMLHQMFEGDDLVHQSEFTKFEFNPNLTKDDFKV